MSLQMQLPEEQFRTRQQAHQVAWAGAPSNTGRASDSRGNVLLSLDNDARYRTCGRRCRWCP
jgi:hypothetical protein